MARSLLSGRRFKQLSSACFLAFHFGVLTWLPGVGLVGRSGTNMQMAAAVDHLQRHHLRQQPGHDQASNE